MKDNSKDIIVADVQRELDTQLSNPETMKALIVTTFNGMQPEVVRQAMLEGMLRGFQFKDFLNKNVYAIPYGDKYSLVTSIDYARKIGMRSGIVGVLPPQFDLDDGDFPVACTVTVKRKAPGSDYIGEFSATVYMAEYMSQKAIWKAKPRTMLSKVAEAHALRKACPEELDKTYISEEFDKPEGEAPSRRPTIDTKACEQQLKSAKNLEELKFIWASLPPEAKADKGLFDLKQALKQGFGAKPDAQ